ncbi:hypothetical protein CEY04_04130 [Achromobacter sp. HZ28]|nr:hypothetical protein CEY05_04135 [Achromobacter sp. HZ34]OWT82621.1 hypothetical protein CEY04_04130 [Achromobacter sp. HZ28]
MRWRSAIALLVLVPCTMAAVGWRDLRELRRGLELQAIDVAAAGTADGTANGAADAAANGGANYNDARIELVGLRAIPFEPGLPEDRTFLRARLVVEPQHPNTQWLDCTIRVVDFAGRAWTDIDPVPRLVRRTLARPGEAEGTGCKGLAVTQAKPGSKVVIDAYYLVPRRVLDDLHVTMSTMDGRPAYLRFPKSPAQ